MANVFPNSNLATSSQPWGREVQKRVETLESQLSLQRTNGATVDAQLQSSYRRLDETVKDLIQADLDIQAALVQSNKAIADAAAAATAASTAATAASTAATTANSAISALTSLGTASSTYTLNANNITSGTARDNTLNLSSANASINLFNGGVNINGPSAQIQVGTSGNGGTNVEGSVTFRGALFGLGMNAAGTNTANVRRNTGTDKELVHTNQSSIRFKKDVVDLITIEELDPKKLLDLPVRAFRYKDDYPIPPSDCRYKKIIPGFIAEEVAEFYSIAADRQDGNVDIVENWNERMVIPGMLALIQDLYKRIEILENDKV